MMSLLELDYLMAKGRVGAKLPRLLEEAASRKHSTLQILDITTAVYHAFQGVPRALIPELPDRILAATAMAHRLPIITVDRSLRSWEELTVVW